MGARGPKPQSNVVRLLRGNPSKKPINTEAPKVAAKVPKCPTDLNQEARREWRYIVPKLAKSKIITELDKAILVAYCVAYADYMDAVRHLNDAPKIIAITREERQSDGSTRQVATGQAQENPWLYVKNRAFKQMKQTIAELGLSPSGRSQLLASATKGHGDEPADGTDPLGLLR